MARGFTYERDWQTACLSAGLLVALVVASHCLYCLTRAYHGSTYHYLPRLNELENAFADAIDQIPLPGEGAFRPAPSYPRATSRAGMHTGRRSSS